MNRKPPRVFYGWWIVGSAFFVALYTSGTIGYGFTAVFEPLANEFGWSYTQISLGASLRGLEIGLLAPVVGLLVDRWGPRRLMLGGVTFTALGLIVLSRTTSLGMFYGAMALLAIGVSTSSSTVLMTAVTNWFNRRVGLAIGIAAAGHGFGGLLVPVVVKLIDVYEWRTAMAILGVGMLAIGLPLSALVRHKPEQYGYHLDGDADSGTAPGSGGIPVQAGQVDFGVRQAVKSRMFWHIALALAFQSMVLGAVTTHIMPYLSSVGIARATAGLAASGVPLLSIIGRLSFGRLADEFDKRQVVAGGFAIMTIGLLFFNYVDTSRMWLLVLFVSLFGIGQGGLVVMRVALLREYFGRANFGAIHGFVVGILALGRVAGASLPGMVYDNWGGYQNIWLGFAALIAVALLIGATMPPLRAAAQPTDR